VKSRSSQRSPSISSCSLAGVPAEQDNDQADDVEDRGGDEVLVVFGRVPVALPLLGQELDLGDRRAVGTPEHRLERLHDKVHDRRPHVGEPLTQQGELLLGDLVERVPQGPRSSCYDRITDTDRDALHPVTDRPLMTE